MRTITALLLLIAASAAPAQSLFMSELAGDRDVPLTWGIGGNFFTMDHEYDIARLDFNFPGVTIPDPNVVGVRNEVWHIDAKLDAWVLPFLNLFVVAGVVEGDTAVDLSRVPLPLPIPLGTLPISYDGESYGGGATLAVGGDAWFAAVTTVYTESNLSGEFNSSVEALTVQPRIGINRGPWQYWLGAMYLDAEEEHSGAVAIPFLGTIEFDVLLEEQNKWNYAIGARHEFNKHFDLSLEVGFGDRDHTLLYAGYRF